MLGLLFADACKIDQPASVGSLDQRTTMVTDACRRTRQLPQGSVNLHLLTARGSHTPRVSTEGYRSQVAEAGASATAAHGASSASPAAARMISGARSGA